MNVMASTCDGLVWLREAIPVWGIASPRFPSLELAITKLLVLSNISYE